LRGRPARDPITVTRYGWQIQAVDGDDSARLKAWSAEFVIVPTSVRARSCPAGAVYARLKPRATWQVAEKASNLNSEVRTQNCERRTLAHFRKLLSSEF
jgi:hypothetical protein